VVNVNDKFQDPSGSVYTIMEVRYGKLGTNNYEYQCLCRRQDGKASWISVELIESICTKL